MLELGPMLRALMRNKIGALLIALQNRLNFNHHGQCNFHDDRAQCANGAAKWFG